MNYDECFSYNVLSGFINVAKVVAQTNNYGSKLKDI